MLLGLGGLLQLRHAARCAGLEVNELQLDITFEPASVHSSVRTAVLLVRFESVLARPAIA